MALNHHKNRGPSKSREVPAWLNWEYVQTSVSRRWEVLSKLRQVLWLKPRDASLSELREIIEVNGDLGKGKYGKVYKVQLTSSFCSSMPYPFALKIVRVHDCKSERLDLITRVMRENQAFAYTNGLVFLGISPNFPLVSRAYFTKGTKKHRRTSYFCCLLAMEYENGTFREWLQLSNHLENAREMMYAIFQVMMGIAAYVKHLRMCHNDLYFKNILYSKMDSIEFVYKLSGRHYYLKNCRYLFKISDFGISSSPDYLNNLHTDITHLDVENLSTDSLRHLNFKEHILNYRNVQPYARDLVTVLRSLSLITRLHESVQKWVNNSLLTLEKYCAANRMHNWDGTIQFIDEIFSPAFLSYAKLSSTLFSLPEGRIPKTSEVFNVDGTGSHKDIASQLAWLSSDHFHGSTQLPNSKTSKQKNRKK